MSTDNFTGMDLAKPTSKVLAPPGGMTSISFGGWDDPAPVTKERPVSVCQAERMRSSVFDDEEPPKRTVPIVPVQPQQAVNPCQAARMRSSVFAAFTDEKAQAVPVSQPTPEQPPAPVVEESKPAPPFATSVPEPAPAQPLKPVQTPAQPPAPVQAPEPVAPVPTPVAAPAPTPQPAPSNPITSPILPGDRPIGVAAPQPRSVRIIKPPGGGSSITFG